MEIPIRKKAMHKEYSGKTDAAAATTNHSARDAHRPPPTPIPSPFRGYSLKGVVIMIHKPPTIFSIILCSIEFELAHKLYYLKHNKSKSMSFL